jgi:hypothetical protein
MPKKVKRDGHRYAVQRLESSKFLYSDKECEGVHHELPRCRSRFSAAMPKKIKRDGHQHCVLYQNSFTHSPFFPLLTLELSLKWGEGKEKESIVLPFDAEAEVEDVVAGWLPLTFAPC